MKFLSIFTPDPKQSSAAHRPENMEEMEKLVEESMKAGTLVTTGGLLPISMGGARVRSFGGDISITDGPFTETKEVIVGFAILEANSKEHVIELTRKFFKVAGDGECELRQIMTEPDCAKQ